MIKKLLLTSLIFAVAGGIIFLITKETPAAKSEAQKVKTDEKITKVNNTTSVKRTAKAINKDEKPIPTSNLNTSLTTESAKDIIDKLRDFFNQNQNRKGIPTANRDTYIKQLKALGDKAIPDIKSVLFSNSENTYLKLALLQVLGGIRNTQTTDILTDLANTTTVEDKIRGKAVDMLTHRVPTKTYDIVKNIFANEPNFQQRHTLVKALGDSKDERAIQLLFKIVENDADKSSRYLAVDVGLSQFSTNPQVIEKLKEYATTNPDPAIRRNSIVTLSKRKDDQTKVFLQDLLKTEKDPDVVRAANTILTRW